MKKKYIILFFSMMICLIMISVPYFYNDIEAKDILEKELHSVDSDNDLLPDYRELEFGTDPYNADTDSDLLLDIDELYLGTSPTLWDTDNDHIADGHERGSRLGSTSPFEKDTDGDGLPDPWEDNDGDGLLNREEQLPIHDGLCYYTDLFHDPPDEPHMTTDPNNADTDGDGWNDGYEVQVDATHTGTNAVNPPPPVDRKNPDLDITSTTSWAYSYLTDPSIVGGAWDTATFADWRNGLKLAGSYGIIPAQCTNISWYHFSPWYVYEQRGITKNFTDWKNNDTFIGDWKDLDRGSPYDWNWYDCDPTLNDTDTDEMDDNWDPYPLRINLRNGTYVAINSIRPVGKGLVVASAPKETDWNYFGRDISILELEKGDMIDINISVGFQECSPDNFTHVNYEKSHFNPMRVIIGFRRVELGLDGKPHSPPDPDNDDNWDFPNVARLTRTFTNVNTSHVLPGMKEVNFTNHLGINSTITFYYQTFRIRIPSRVPAGFIAITVETDSTDNFHYFPSEPFIAY